MSSWYPVEKDNSIKMIVQCKLNSTFSNKRYESSEEGGFMLIGGSRMLFNMESAERVGNEEESEGQRKWKGAQVVLFR